MKKVFIYFIFLIIFSQSSLNAYSTNPKDFINELVTEVITTLSNKNLN